MHRFLRRFLTYRPAWRRPHAARLSASSFQPQVEVLEERLAFSTHWGTGGAEVAGIGPGCTLAAAPGATAAPGGSLDLSLVAQAGQTQEAPDGHPLTPATDEAPAPSLDDGDPYESASTPMADDPSEAGAAAPHGGEAIADDAGPLSGLGGPDGDATEVGELEGILEAELLDMIDEVPLFVLNLEEFDPDEVEVSPEAPAALGEAAGSAVRRAAVR